MHSIRHTAATLHLLHARSPFGLRAARIRKARGRAAAGPRSRAGAQARRPRTPVRDRNLRGAFAKTQVLCEEPAWNRRGTRRNLCGSSCSAIGVSEKPSRSHKFTVRNQHGTASEPAGAFVDPRVSRSEFQRNRREAISFARGTRVEPFRNPPDLLWILRFCERNLRGTVAKP